MNAPAASQIRLVIVGATGMVGGYALRYALDHPSVGVVTVIGRRKLGISHPKLKEVVHLDFGDCSALAKPLSDQDAAIFCLGVYTGAVPDAEFRKITVDYTIEFARVLRASSPGAAFSFLSGSGADQTEQSRIAFARYKGKAEKALLAAGFHLSCRSGGLNKIQVIEGGTLDLHQDLVACDGRRRYIVQQQLPTVFQQSDGFHANSP